MMLTWRERYGWRAAAAMSRLSGVLGRTSDRSVSLGHTGDFDTCVEIIGSAASFDRRISEGKRVAIARKAVLDSFRAGTFDENCVLSLMRRGQSEHLRMAARAFTLVTSISLRPDPAFRSSRVGDAYIQISRSLPARYVFPRQHGLEDRKKWDVPNGYSIALVKVVALDAESAFDLAVQSLDYLRAIWNLLVSRGSWRRGGDTEAINQIVRGPRCTVHTGDGNPAASFWYNPMVQGSAPALLVRTSIGAD